MKRRIEETQRPPLEQLQILQHKIIRCRLCPRLVRWREKVARVKVARFADEDYWGKPVPSFGDAEARLLIVGLAPAAHGGNRTGRMFTGDRSGDWLYHALSRAGFANQSSSISRFDGLKLIDCYITASARCAPPLNKLLPKELSNCRPYLIQEMKILEFDGSSSNPRVVVALGKVAFDTFLKAFGEIAGRALKPHPKFFHGAEVRLDRALTLIASFHPSQQNTFTGKLTEPMFNRIFARAKRLIEG
ncbi:MAG: uracil-DNA glycosylase [Acidobacteriia bacterium]|nr:uracil-DNA glycosylase [Terriglobia bacterium]